MTRGLWTPGHLWITPFECRLMSCPSSTVLALSHPAYVTQFAVFDTEKAKVAGSRTTARRRVDAAKIILPWAAHDRSPRGHRS